MDVEQRLTRDLTVLAGTSLVVGTALLRSTSPTLRGVGRQAVAWGAVDGGIAAVGTARRGRRGPTRPARLRRVLLVNAALDVGYVLTGAALAVRAPALAARLPRRPDPALLRGDGVGVVVQGLALLVLDTTHARRLG